MSAVSRRLFLFECIELNSISPLFSSSSSPNDISFAGALSTSFCIPCINSPNINVCVPSSILAVGDLSECAAFSSLFGLSDKKGYSFDKEDELCSGDVENRFLGGPEDEAKARFLPLNGPLPPDVSTLLLFSKLLKLRPISWKISISDGELKRLRAAGEVSEECLGESTTSPLLALRVFLAGESTSAVLAGLI